MRRRAMIGLLLSSCALSGCAQLAGSAMSDASTVLGLASTVTTGKGLGDHVLSFLTGEDCNLTEGLTRDDRDICEKPGSVATLKDFKGLYQEAKAIGGRAFLPAVVTDDAAEFDARPELVWTAMRKADAALAAAKTEKSLAAVDSGATQEPAADAALQTQEASETEAMLEDILSIRNDFAVNIDPAMGLELRSVEGAGAQASDEGQSAIDALLESTHAPDAKPLAPDSQANTLSLRVRPKLAPKPEPEIAWAGEGGPLLPVMGEVMTGSVTKSIEGGEPVVVVRLVPVEASAAKPPRLDEVIAAAPPATPIPSAETLNPNGIEPAALPSPEAAAVPAAPDTAPLGEPAAAIDPASLGATGEPLLTGAEAAPLEAAAPVARFSSARPRQKPDLETGVGGAFDLLPPAPGTDLTGPKPMRLNSVAPKSNTASSEPQKRSPRTKKSRDRAAAPSNPNVTVNLPAGPDPLDLPAQSRAVPRGESAAAAPSIEAPVSGPTNLTTSGPALNLIEATPLAPPPGTTATP